MSTHSIIPREIIAISCIDLPKGNQVQPTHGLETTVAELDALSRDARKHFLTRYRQFYEALPLYHTLNDGNLIIAHAGIREEMIGAPYSEKIRVFRSLWRYHGQKITRWQTP